MANVFSCEKFPMQTPCLSGADVIRLYPLREGRKLCAETDNET